MHLLAVGDLHLGRRPGRLPEPVLTRLGARRLGPAEALERLVSAARRHAVDAVVFAGDVVEQADDFFEAYAELRRSVTALVDAGIPVFGVAGNHDVQVLPQLAEEVAGFRLLGAGGTWESTTLTGRDGVQAIIHGASFSAPLVHDSPLAGVRFDASPLPQLGLLHCDRDQPGSGHAPVTSRQLEEAGVDAWLLGHIHKPDPLDRTRPSGYLGSVTALRASETGPRGPWLYTIGSQGIEQVEQWPLAPLRWQQIDVDISGMSAATDVRPRIIAAAEAAAADIATTQFRPDAIGLRVRLHGRTRIGHAVEQLLENETLDDLPLTGGIQGFVGRWWLDTRPEVDLSPLARRPDPAGLLARRLRLLDEAPADDPERQALITRAREHLNTAHRDPAWSRLNAAPPDDDAIADWLRRGAVISLDALLAQQEDANQ
ncbi:metallophosphoesterase [Aquisalimonas sp.]|uniref:metallophosphoesterase family protein n=1 Tax=unclassified Aquisalimonas TaxID=2644645 RepID=UPI0025BA81CA|nr:metallophosphoesterase [Aquisalimonas sp.]